MAGDTEGCDLRFLEVGNEVYQPGAQQETDDLVKLDHLRRFYLIKDYL